jgi:hypothetical protein
MYWPCGVPRIYAYNGPKDLETGTKDYDGHDKASQSSDEVEEVRAQTSKNQPARAEGEYDSSISDLRVARLDHIFVTISASCLTIWSSRVRLPILLGRSQLIWLAYHCIGKGCSFEIVYRSVWY